MAKKKITKKKVAKKKVAKKISKKKSTAKKATAKKKVAKKAATKKKKKVAKKVTKKANVKKVVKKKVAKKVTKKATKKAPKKVAKKPSKKAIDKNEDLTEKTSKKVVKADESASLEIEIKQEAPVSKALNDIKEALKVETKKVKPSTKNNLEELEGLSVRKARLIEKYIRQGKSWVDIEKVISEFAVGYNMKEEFAARSVIHHKNMGVGYVMTASNNRMMVYFQEGIKNLIMNFGS